VERHRAEFLELIRTGMVDLVLANEHELRSLYMTANFNTALAAVRQDARLAAITMSEKGCIVVSREATNAVPAVPVERVVDATGAGDLFAAGFLVGLARGADDRTAARLGALAAAEAISHVGARPQTSLAALAEGNGLGL
jgi:sugar/nucleoside kinase (ribokinase family)